jgi:hypothetical protein
MSVLGSYCASKPLWMNDRFPPIANGVALSARNNLRTKKTQSGGCNGGSKKKELIYSK